VPAARSANAAAANASAGFAVGADDGAVLDGAAAGDGTESTGAEGALGSMSGGASVVDGGASWRSVAAVGCAIGDSSPDGADSVLRRPLRVGSSSSANIVGAAAGVGIIG
jgi:hypothetical protein